MKIKKGLMILPGMADVHVHLRVPGGEHKEDYRTGSAAALAGGITSLMAMPNTTPPILTLEGWQAAQKKANDESLCDVALFAGASVTCMNSLPELSRHAPALKLYMDLTYGELRVDGIENLEQIAQLWPREKVLALHAEGESVKTGLGLAAKYNRRVHFCHISRKDEIEWIAEAKHQGVPVTCEVTPHHLFLNESDARRLGPLGDMRPRLARLSDVDALWAHINTTIDCVASDHAPHTLAEKQNSENPPPGVPGLESTLPLLLMAAAESRISYERLVALLAVNPRQIYGLPEQPDTWVEIDPMASYVFPDHSLYTKCGWSPFTGITVKGRIRKVVLRGKEVAKDGIVHQFVR
ncbi:MAG: amidohydrolase family protein [Anaerolineaceae bacterium]|nr:amidohydrolase family protein [Anaerolineaceae bacterium]